MLKKSWRGDWTLGRLLSINELANYGIDDAKALAVIGSAETALECVKRAPELHIISMFKAHKLHFYNRYISGADAYYLACGDRNPDLFKVCEPLCMADVSELEELMRESNQGELCAFDHSLIRLLRLIVTNNASPGGLDNPDSR